ncbi:DUF1385 domain-containing protein [Brevibacillus laterosporus]|uniref:DUF1385 domain-containing protein n=1 Tax=Brevibacillus laterosporus TaxID=1465 RepID=UPI003D1CDD81
MLSPTDVNGGRASLNGVMFFSDHYVSKATLSSSGAIEVKRKKRIEQKVRFLSFFERIPFIRGLAVMGQLVLAERKIRIFYSIVACMWAYIFIIGKWFPETHPEIKIMIPISLNNIVYFIILSLFIVLFIGLAVIRFSKLSRYHGAEHMAYNAFNAGVDLTIDNVRKMSRVSDNCGTNLITMLVVILIILMFLFPYMPLSNLFLSLSISYEIFRLEGNIISKPFIALGGFVQKYISTVEPDDKQIETAILALKALDE